MRLDTGIESFRAGTKPFPRDPYSAVFWDFQFKNFSGMKMSLEAGMGRIHWDGKILGKVFILMRKHKKLGTVLRLGHVSAARHDESLENSS